MTDVSERPRVLFVDDDANLLKGIERQIRGFVTADLVTSPVEAAGILEGSTETGETPYAVVVSDMRMPEMDGTALLEYAKTVCPDTTRMLLTAYADMDSAIEAVNEANIFRFLTKPCPTVTLRAALLDAVEQHRMLRERREALELTLRGTVETLVEALAMTHPAAFARAARLRRITRDVAIRLDLTDRWRVEVAAQLVDIGLVILPPTALDALTRGNVTVRPAVNDMLAQVAVVREQLLSRIPGLEPVRSIIQAQQPVDEPDPRALLDADQSTRVLQAIREYDALVLRGHAVSEAVAVLRGRVHHETETIDALAWAVRAETVTGAREVDVGDLTPGLVMADTVRTGSGMILAMGGQLLTPELVIRIRNHASLDRLVGRIMIRSRIG
jgi:CheY-like chemotaxis protein